MYLDNKSQSSYFTKKQLILVFAILLVGIFMRWWQLDMRPYHHDEALHAIHGYYVYTDPDNKFYRYTPLLHGPLLYNLYPFIYDTFGVSNWSGRFHVAFLGTLFLFIPFLFRRFFTPPFFIVMLTFFSISPSLIYWSRFARHDFLMISCMLLLLHAVININIKEHWKGFWVVIGLILPLCIKENSYILYALLIGFLLYQTLLTPKESLFIKIIHYLKKYPLLTFAGFAVASLIYCYLFSGGFRYSEGILDGIYRKSLVYWWNQHGMERIKGPFLFYFFCLSWYEWAFISLLTLQILHFYNKLSGYYLAGIIITLTLSTLFYLGYNTLIPPISFLKSFFKLKFPLDAIAPLFLIGQAFITTTFHLKQKKIALAFFGYWFWASLFTYSFLGEKVPWLMSYSFIPGVIYVIIYWQEHLPPLLPHIPKNVLITLFILFVLFNLRLSIITNFSRAGAATEYISQVHTTKDFELIAMKIREEVRYGTEAYKTTCLTLGDSVWPMSWYMRDLYPQYQFYLPTFETENRYHYVFMNKDAEGTSSLNLTHNTHLIPLRHWWVPDFELMGFKEFFIYTFFHVPWNKPGSMTIFYAKKRPKML